MTLPSFDPNTHDPTTNAPFGIDYAHYKAHIGDAYYVTYGVPSLGAMTTPDDMITISFTTANTTKWMHFTFEARGTSGWRIRLIRTSTGGGATPTGNLSIFNNNENSSNTSGAIALDTTVNKMSYDATLLTGGVSLIDDYLEGGKYQSSSPSGPRDEIILKQNTLYQVSLYGVDLDPGTLKLKWYEHSSNG